MVVVDQLAAANEACVGVTVTNEASLIPIGNFLLRTIDLLSDKSPSEVIVNLSEPAVINCKASLSAPADTSATIFVSWSTSVTPPREPQVFPAP